MSELALKLIAENKKTRSPFLDLGNCDLTEVPEEISELVWLEELSFASEWRYFDSNKWITQKSQNEGLKNNIAHLASTAFGKRMSWFGKSVKSSPFSSLINLKKLYLIGSWDEPIAFKDVSPLSDLTNLQWLDLSFTQVTDLSPLSGLVNLQELSVRKTQVTDLSKLSGLANLKELNISNTSVIDLSPLSELTNLERLTVSNTQVTDLSTLSRLSKLQELYVSNTPVSDLSPLSGLANLKKLNIRYTQISDLSPLLELIRNDIPVLWGSDTLSGEDGIYVENCPWTNPPAEIVKQGKAVILKFFTKKENQDADDLNLLREKDIQGTELLYEAKMLLIGEGGAGKTSLLRRLYQPEKTLPNANETTKGIDIYRHEFKLDNGRNFRLNVWDFGGQEIYHATHQFFLTKRSLYVLLDDTGKDNKTVHDAAFKYWLEVADLLGDHSPVLIFQNEKGGRSKTIDESGIKAKFNNVKEIYRGNLEQSGPADDLRKDIEHYAKKLPQIGEELPAKWVSIRSDIEQLAKDKPFIYQEDYFDIYRKHLEFNRKNALQLSSYLHNLGDFLHFQDGSSLSDIVILQNNWATDAVFKMLDDESVKRNMGQFDKADYQRVWRDSYAEVQDQLLELMKKFELCSPLPDKRDTWLVPQLLPPSKPSKLAEWQKPGDLTLRYRYEFLPKGIVNRLIVRMHRYVKSADLSWFSGALFELDDAELLVEVPDKGGEIILRAHGPECKNLLSIISADLDALNDSFHGLKDLVNKLVPCNCGRCRKLTVPEYFDQKRLLKRKLDSKFRVECPASYECLSVLGLLDGIWVDQLETKVRTIKIFLASSSELEKDRDAFDLHFRQQNDRLRKQGIELKIVRWENFLDAMSETRLQDEYNKEVEACDIFVSLFFTKTGKYTEEEFDTAHKQFLNTKKPLIYTYFKNAPQNLGDIGDEIISLLNFKKKLASLGHFYTGYDNIPELKLKFNDQLEKLKERGF